jgi:hypothetical protein
MKLYSAKCTACNTEKDFKYKSKFTRINVSSFLCKVCKKLKSIEGRTRSCPKCKQKIISQSLQNKNKAEKLNSICKNCRSNQIPQTLTQEQREFLAGHLLGDGSIVYSHNGSLYPRLCLQRQYLDKDYVNYQFNLLKEFYSNEPKHRKVFDSRTNKVYENYALISKSGLIFKELYKKWYPNGKKIIPKDFNITPLTLLIWFLDDGCIINLSKNALQIKFSTDGFSKNDVKFLHSLISNYTKEKFHIYKNGTGYVIRGSTLAALKIIEIIDPIFPDFMNRKRTWKYFDFNYVLENINNFN